MYTRDEIKLLKKEFWEGFGFFCANHPVLGKRKSKFLLYNTKMKGVVPLVLHAGGQRKDDEKW